MKPINQEKTLQLATAKAGMSDSQIGHANSAKFSAWRVLALSIPLLVIGAVWVEVSESYLQTEVYFLGNATDEQVLPTGVARSIPPAAALGLFIPVLMLCGLVPVLRRRWRIRRAELVSVFFVLFLGLPMIGPGLWKSFVPLQNDYHRRRQLDMAMNLSPNLWATEGNILAGASAEDATVEGAHWSCSNEATTTLTDVPGDDEQCIRIVNESGDDVSRVRLELDGWYPGGFPEPMVRYAVFASIRVDDPGAASAVTLWAGSDPNRLQSIISPLRRRTEPELLAPRRFKMNGKIDYAAPRNIGEKFYVELQFVGQGTVYAKDFGIVDTEQVYRYLEGYREATPEVYESLSAADRVGVRVRPANKWSLAYVRHVLFGMAPWGVWARPLAVWGLLVGGMFLGMFCLVTLFYQQWEKGDRLTFPLQTFVLELTKGDERRGLAFLRSGPFWIGFAACSLHLSLQQLNSYFPDVPCMNLNLAITQILPANVLSEVIKDPEAVREMQIQIHPLFVAVAFFISMEMSFSMVFFYLLTWVYRFVGYFTPLKTQVLAHHRATFPFKHLLATGGLLFMAFFCVFAARKHLAKVASRVFLGRSSVDDSDEALSYRAATLGLVVALGMLLGFAHYAELNPVFVLIYLGMCLLLALSAARIRAEVGICNPSIVLWWPQVFLAGMGGVLLFGFREWSFTGQAFFLYAGVFLLSAPIMAESMSAARQVGMPLRKLGRCLTGGFVVAVVVGGIVTMSWRYTVGALNMNDMRQAVVQRGGLINQVLETQERQNEDIKQYFHAHPEVEPVLTEENRWAVARFEGSARAPAIDWWTIGIAGVSFVITGLLALARMIWLSFPLHPLGFALAFTPALQHIWSSVALAWGVKYLGLRFGGVQFSRQFLRPFFVGVFTSSLMMIVAWDLLDAVLRVSLRGQVGG